MKKLFFACIGLLFANIANAQFKATKDGIKTDDGNDFYVVSIDGKSAKELFDNVESYVISNFKNPDAVLSKQDGKMINIHGIFPSAIPCKKWAGMNYADIDLNLIISFKDSKMKIDAPSINSMVCRTLKSNSGGYYKYCFYSKEGGFFTGCYSLFNKKGDVKNKLAVNGINDFLTHLISEIIDCAKGDSNNDW